MHTIARLLTYALLAGIAGCATPYKKMSGGCGFDDFRLTEDTFEVSFFGNVKTSPPMVARYVHRRAAEVTLASGYTHYLVVGAKDESRGGTFSTGTSQSATYGYNQPPQTQSIGSAWGVNAPFRLPGETIRIKCFRKPLPEVDGLIDAQNFLSYNFPAK